MSRSARLPALFASAVLALTSLAWSAVAAAAEPDDTTAPVAPGNKGGRPFWNGFAKRFIYAPAFDLADVPGAASYRFAVTGADQRSRQFTADHPRAALSPVWADLPEGFTSLVVEALGPDGAVIGRAGERAFYRSPGFSGSAGDPLVPYADAARTGLRALFEEPHVQHWLAHAKPDRTYSRYCFPSKVIGGLSRAMTAYSQSADSEADRKAALVIARRTADYLRSLTLPADAYYASVPPTFMVADVDKAVPQQTYERFEARWLMVPSIVDATLAYLDLYDVTRESIYLDAATAAARSLVKTQEPDGTWPLRVDWKTGQPIAPQRQVPTWIIFFFDRLDRQYGLIEFRESRQKAWDYIERNPMKTYQWDGQFEDIEPLPPYANLSREQACDVALLLLSKTNRDPRRIEQAEELLRFAEDQFVIWSEIKDAAGWRQAMEVKRRQRKCETWLAPSVMEQFACYEPVARSSAVLINSYLKAHEVTRKAMYLEKAAALANGLLIGQKWFAENADGNGEIPTWVNRVRATNWLNNSYYAAKAVEDLAAYQAAAEARPG